ncbi:MAG: terminase family protein [Nitrososphaerota archaeon]
MFRLRGKGLKGSSSADQDSSSSRRHLLRLLVEKPSLFCKAVLGFKPYPYQEKFLDDPSRRIIVCSGRQVGKSTSAAAKALHFATTRAGSTCLIVSATLRQSMITFEKIRRFAENSILRYSLRRSSGSTIELENGSRIIALPCGRGDTLRGYTAHLLVLDEAAFMPEKVIANIALPMIASTSGYCWMLSTPWEKNHIFYRIWCGSGEWSRYHWPSRLNPMISEAFLMEQRRLIGEERFQVEYEACFLDDSSSFLPMSLLRRCAEDYEPEIIEGAVYGYDPGGRESLAAVVGVIYEEKERRWRVSYWRAEKCESYIEFDALLHEIHGRAPMRMLVVDETGIGGPIVEHLRELGLPVVGVKLMERVKEEIFGRLKLMLERGKLAIPNDPQFLSHLNCVEYQRTWSGGYRFSHRPGSHDDLAYALALALHEQRSEAFLA